MLKPACWLAPAPRRKRLAPPRSPFGGAFCLGAQTRARLGDLLRRIDGRAHGDHHPRARGRLHSATPPMGVAAMVKNLVAGCVLVALIFMALLAYAQEHHECLNGHLIVRGHLFKGLRSCG